jgi:hypothetical protein
VIFGSPHARPTALWPLFHYLLWQDSPVSLPAPDPTWQAYQETNLLFAKRVAELYKPGDLIIVHDYHLLLVPKMIRECLHQVSPYVPPHHQPVEQPVVPEGSQATPMAQDGRPVTTADGKPTSPMTLGNLGGETREQGELGIGMFIHTPWPSSEIFRCLPSESKYTDRRGTCRLSLLIHCRAQGDPRRYARCQPRLLPDLFVLATLCFDLYPGLRLRVDSRRD